MRTTLVLSVLAGLPSCSPHPVAPLANPPREYRAEPRQAPPPIANDREAPYRAIGTEPFWDLTIGRDLIFTDRGNGLSVSEPAPPPRRGVAGETYQSRRLTVKIVHTSCSDGMSDRVYPDTVSVTVDGHSYRGCGAPTVFFTRAIH
jgi:uncharacterized membrane protein